LNDVGWKFVVGLELALRLGVEQIVVVGIPRQANSKQQVWPEVVVSSAQVGFLLEEWEE
jgi:hypothetical protein